VFFVTAQLTGREKEADLGGQGQDLSGDRADTRTEQADCGLSLWQRPVQVGGRNSHPGGDEGGFRSTHRPL